MGFSFSNIKDKISDFINGGSYNDSMDKANEYYAKAANVKNKSTKELQQEGREAASQAAADKAGQAKKQAKAASMQNGGNRLQAANAAASAAANAGTEGYDTTANTMTNIAQQQDTAEKNAERSALTAQGNAYAQDAANRQSDTNTKLQLAGQFLAGKMTSDCSKKKVKHTYIPLEKRVNKGGLDKKSTEEK